MKFLDNALGGLTLVFVVIKIWSKICDVKINYKNYKFYFVLILLAIVSLLNYHFTNTFVRIFLISVIMMICANYLFKIGIKKSCLLVIITQTVYMVCDAAVAILMTVLLNLNTYSSNKGLSIFLINLIVSIMAWNVFKLPIFKKIYNQLILKTEKLREFQVLILVGVVLLFGNLFTMSLYSTASFRTVILINTLFTLFCLFIVIYLLKTQNKYNNVYDKYNTTLNSLKEYEDILDRYRVSNHENKNQLLTIRNMISKSDKKTISYIDKIVENKLKDNDKVMFEVSIIPAGGLRGLIYSKVLTMKDSKINYELEISNNVKTVDLISLDDSLMLDICQIIGVYFDNAIEEVKKLKEKYINIEMYIDEKELILEISNNYKGKIDIGKLEDKGYTSKGKGHGYGLSLVKEIIDRNKSLTNQKRISKEVFTQILKIKM